MTNKRTNKAILRVGCVCLFVLVFFLSLYMCGRTGGCLNYGCGRPKKKTSSGQFRPHPHPPAPD